MFVTQQWIKSVDDQGQTYYYLRDGSKSQWHLPEVNVLHYVAINEKQCIHNVQ